MKKKFYFYSLKAKIACLIPMLIFAGLLALLIVYRQTQQPETVVIVASMLLFIILLCAVGFVLTFFIRIEFNYDKKELLIHKHYFVKKIKFEEIESIEIIDYETPGFVFVIVTKNFIKRISFFALPFINEIIDNKAKETEEDIKKRLAEISDNCLFVHVKNKDATNKENKIKFFNIHFLSHIPIVGQEVAWVLSCAKKDLKKENNLFRKVYYLSFIPIVGMFVAWIVACVKMCKQTEKQYLGVHVIASLVYSFMVTAVLFVICYIFHGSINGDLYLLGCLIVSYLGEVIIGKITCSLAQKCVKLYNDEQNAKKKAKR